MSAKIYLALVAACIAIVSTFAAPQASSLTSDSVRFSRLLSKQPDLLRFTSISNLGPASPVLEPKFQSVFNAQETNQAKKTGLSSEQFLRRTENLGDDALLITKAEPGQEYVYIHQEIKQGGESTIPTESLTSLNQKPSGRKPFALLRQSAGNKLNISPVFPDSNARNNLNGNSQVSILSDISNQDESSDATTPSPYFSGADEEAEAVTTESVQDDDVPVTTFPPTQEKKGRMIINVVTSAPRFVVENTTTPSPATTTVVPKAKPQERPAQADVSEDDENLVVDAFHRNGHFPDFEDSPAHLHTAESAQPARVNVRPASSGKDYEYEYIYYYYDDEDDDNSTSKKAAADSKGAVTKVIDEAAAVEPNNSFDAEKISVASVPTNSLDSPVVSRGQKAIVEDSLAANPQAQESQDEVAQVTTVLPEILRTRRPNSVNRPIVLKQSNMSPATAEAPVATTPSRRVISTTTTTTTTSAPPTESARSRLRFKSRTEAAAVNNVVRPTEETSEAPAAEAPSRRPYKDAASRRRNPTRRLNGAQQQPEAPVEEQAAPVPVQAAPVAEEPARLPIRTRFPPRVTTTTTTQAAVVPEVAVTEAALAPVASQEVASSPVQSIEVQSPVAIESERKAKDNFARQKSINDLYALTRLHQLAINTRIPNRKADGVTKGTPPKNAAGFVNSAEQTTKYADDIIASNEATTFASAFPSAASAESVPSTENVPQTLAPTTTTTTTTEAAPERGGKQRNRFRPRGNRLNTAAAEGPSSTTTETAPSRAPAASPSRFGGRRRFSTTAAPDAAPSAATVTETEQRPVQVRQPSRNRFSGRTRPTTSTTEATETAATGEQASEAQSERPQAPRRRPNNFQGRRRQQSSTPQTAQSEDAEVSASPATTVAAARPSPRSNAESERRRFNFGNPARNRPSGPGSGAERPRPLVRGGRTSTTEAPEVQAEQENPEPIVSEQVSVSETEVQAEKPESNPEEHAPVVSVSSTTSSSVSSDVLVSKKGSAAVLGRLRNRTKPISTTTTVAPEVQAAAERKPSRLSGILNRRKLGSQPAPAAVKEEPAHEEHEANLSPEHEEIQRKGVVVQVSSTVTESEEVGDNLEHESDQQSSTTHTSLLNRLKSQRKPGQIYRKGHSNSSE